MREPKLAASYLSQIANCLRPRSHGIWLTCLVTKQLKIIRVLKSHSNDIIFVAAAPHRSIGISTNWRSEKVKQICERPPLVRFLVRHNFSNVRITIRIGDVRRFLKTNKQVGCDPADHNNFIVGRSLRCNLQLNLM